MKKIIALLLALVLLVSMSACGSETSTTTTSSAETDTQSEAATPSAETDTQSAENEETGYEDLSIGFSVVSMSDTYVAGYANGTKEKWEELGTTVTIADCDQDANTQIQQIENFITMGVDAIIVQPYEYSGLETVYNKANDAGIKVLSLSIAPETGWYVTMEIPQKELGMTAAAMASAWLDEAYPDAEEGSIHVALLVDKGIETILQRCEGLEEGILQDPRVTVTFTKEGCMSLEDGNNGMEEALTVDPEIKLVLTWTEMLAIGADNVVKSRNLDISEFGIFSTGISDTTKSLISDSVDNLSAYRGTVIIGNEDYSVDIFNTSKAMIDGELSAGTVTYDSLVPYNEFGYTG